MITPEKNDFIKLCKPRKKLKLKKIIELDSATLVFIVIYAI